MGISFITVYRSFLHFLFRRMFSYGGFFFSSTSELVCDFTKEEKGKRKKRVLSLAVDECTHPSSFSFWVRKSFAFSSLYHAVSSVSCTWPILLILYIRYALTVIRHLLLNIFEVGKRR